MGSQKKRSKTRQRVEAGRRGRAPVQSAKGVSDRNRTRREKYADDPEYAAEQCRRFRDYYRKTSGKTGARESDLAGGKLHARATSKEVHVGHPGTSATDIETAKVYTVRESAQALKRSELTLRRWIKDSIVPAPRLYDCTYGYMHYSQGELRIIARQLAMHERDFDYLHKNHEVTINNIAQAIESWRESGRV